MSGRRPGGASVWGANRVAGGGGGGQGAGRNEGAAGWVRASHGASGGGGAASARVPNDAAWWAAAGGRRRERVRFAAIALIAGGVRFWPPNVSLLGLPLLLTAVRFFELARFRLVHRSGWLLVASLSWLLLATIVMIVNAIARDDPVGNVVWGCIFFALVWLCLRFAARVRAA